MSRPIPTVIAHFTHVDHLATIVRHGLLSDTAAHERGLLTTEIGDRNIKDRRRQRQGSLGSYHSSRNAERVSSG